MQTIRFRAPKSTILLPPVEADRNALRCYCDSAIPNVRDVDVLGCMTIEGTLGDWVTDVEDKSVMSLNDFYGKGESAKNAIIIADDDICPGCMVSPSWESRHHVSCSCGI